MAFITGHSILVPYMNQEGPQAGTYLSDGTRPTYAIGSSIRFRWIVPTGSSKIAFNLLMHGKRASGLAQHELIKAINNTTDWVADGTVVLHGITWDKYYHDYTITDDIPGIYSVCLNSNGRHYFDIKGGGVAKQLMYEADGVAYHHDGGFILTPAAVKHDDDLPYRTELFSRVAGEKAWYEDEFITAGQLEEGSGIRLKYRNAAGFHVDYGTNALFGWNIIVENDFAVGVDTIASVNGTGVPLTWGAATVNQPTDQVTFAPELDWTLDNVLAITATAAVTPLGPNSIPITWDVQQGATGKVHVAARAAHTGLYASHDNGVVTQATGDVHGTIGHIRVKDTASVTWTVTDGNLDGNEGYRPGITLEATAVAYTWNIGANGDGGTAVSSGATVDLSSADGTVVIVRTGDDLDFSRPLTIMDDGVASGDSDVAEINFDSNGQTSTDVPVRFDVIDNEPGNPGRRSIRGFVPAATAPTPDPQPSFIYEWFRPRWGDANVWIGDYDDFEICNQMLCHNEQITTPWGPLDDSLTPAYAAYQKPVWEGPSGAFSKVAGFTTQAASPPATPYVAGAMQVNQDGYYHIDLTQHTIMQRKLLINNMTASPVDYYSRWHIFLMVYRVATGTWLIHHHFDTREIHHQSETDKNPFWPRLASSKDVHLHGSCDVWLNNGDKISFLRSASGVGYDDYYPRVRQQVAWRGVLSYQSCNIHWLHDDTAFAKDDETFTETQFTDTLIGLELPDLSLFWLRNNV